MSDNIDARTAEREEALRAQLAGQRRLARPEDYVYDKSQDGFWDLLDGTLHKADAVDASIPQELWRVVVEEPPPRAEGAPGRPGRRRERLVKPSLDIQRVEIDQFVEASTWWPGMEQLIRDWFVAEGGFFESPGRRLYNQYKAPPVARGDADAAGPWLRHVMKLWPNPAEHEFFFDYCAHMVQRPEEKCNAGIVLSGAQRIGKDTALLPVKAAVGAWNTKGVEPDSLFSEYKPYLQTLMLVVDEARPSKDEFRATAMYNILKPLMAAPPDVLPLNQKYVQLRYVVNVMRVFITTNDYMSLYIPPGDGRIFIMHSALKKEWYLDEDKDYFVNFGAWLAAEGNGHVSAWLRARNLEHFRPKGEVKKTAGWEAVAGTWDEPDDGLTLALEALGKPDVLFGAELASGQFDHADELAGMLKSPRKIGHRMQQEGYAIVKAPGGESRWRFGVEGNPNAFRSKFAFAKSSALADTAKLHAAITARGKGIAAKRAATAF